MVLGKTYKDGSGRYYHESDIDKDRLVHKIHQNNQIFISWEKMSKSKFNGIHAEDWIDEYGSGIHDF